MPILVESIIFLSLLGTTVAADPRILQRDTPPQGCFEPSSRPIDQFNTECPPKNPKHVKLNPDGTCGTMTATGDNPCSQYCEEKIRWFYGPEISFSKDCSADDPDCQIVSTYTTSVTNTHEFNIGFSLGKRDEIFARKVGDPSSPLDRIKGAFNIGASWSWSSTTSDAVALQSEKPTNAAGQCGHWVFVPWHIESCGTPSWADYTPAQDPTTPGGDLTFKPATCGVPKTQKNFCQKMPYKDGNGKAQGSTVFVATDCSSNKPLSFCYQQVPYLNIGVANSPDPYITYLFAHGAKAVQDRSISGEPLLSIVNMCFNDQWTGPFKQDPSWVMDGIGHAKGPAPTNMPKPPSPPKPPVLDPVAKIM